MVGAMARLAVATVVVARRKAAARITATRVALAVTDRVALTRVVLAAVIGQPVTMPVALAAIGRPVTIPVVRAVTALSTAIRRGRRDDRPSGQAAQGQRSRFSRMGG